MKLKIVVGPVCKEDCMCPSGKARRGQSTRRRARPPVGLERRDVPPVGRGRWDAAAGGRQQRDAPPVGLGRWDAGSETRPLVGGRRRELGDGGEARKEAGEG